MKRPAPTPENIPKIIMINEKSLVFNFPVS